MQQYSSPPYERRMAGDLPTSARRINHAEGWRRIAVVFVLAAIGGYLGWSFMRSDYGPNRYPSGPVNHSGIVPYGYPRADAGPHRDDRARSTGYQNCRPYGRHVICDAIQDGLPPGETRWRR
jgi:hypothetical protein